MFYPTGDIERNDNCFIRIRQYLKSCPEIALSVEEMGDFFKMELRLVVPQVTR